MCRKNVAGCKAVEGEICNKQRRGDLEGLAMVVGEAIGKGGGVGRIRSDSSTYGYGARKTATVCNLQKDVIGREVLSIISPDAANKLSTIPLFHHSLERLTRES
ncbi:hypothetical protein J6590_106063 [Homalodisca vitripennis]|nr:hypothetical protein J6590_106063 [Homalodisca vitripennis]